MNHALTRGTGKRGGAVQKLTSEDAILASPERDAQLVEWDAALEKLAAQDERKERIVETRFFCGLSVEETAAVRKVSSQTVAARLKPRQALAGPGNEPGASILKLPPATISSDC